jgi:hypothetical protein
VIVLPQQADADSRVTAAQGAAVSVSQAAIAVVAAIIGSSLISLVGFYLFVRYRRSKQRELEATEREANAALDRAVVSFIDKSDLASPVTPHPAVGYAISQYGDSDPRTANTFSMDDSRPATAEKSAIPGMGIFRLKLAPPRKGKSKTGPLTLNQSQNLETVKEVGSTESLGDGESKEERRYSNWPFSTAR